MTIPQKEIFIIKASGQKELFSDLKLRHSLEKAKTSPGVIAEIISHIRNKLKDGMKTSDIYRYAFSLLHKRDRFTAGRYSLKRAIMELGPSGHPFKISWRIFKSKGVYCESERDSPGSMRFARD